MTEDRDNATQSSPRFVEETELTHDRGAIIVNPFACKFVLRVKHEYAAKRKFQSAASCRQAAPFTKVRAANDDFQHDALGCDVPTLHLDREIGERAHELDVVRADPIAARAVICPRLVVV